MRATKETEPTPMNRTVVERRSDRELVVTRTVNGPARLLFEAWTKPELLKRWWAPCSPSQDGSSSGRLRLTRAQAAQGLRRSFVI